MGFQGELPRGESVALPAATALLSTAALVFVATAFGPSATPATFAALVVLLTAVSFVALARAPERPARRSPLAEGALATFDALPPWAHRMRWLAVLLTTSPWVFFNVVRHLPGSAVLVVLGLYGLIALPIVLPQKVTLGDDGILLKWAGRRRFIPFGAILEARVTALGVELELAGDRLVEIRLTHRRGTATQRGLQLDRRIRAGMDALRALAPADDEALLTRGRRDYDAWFDAMSRIGHASGGYRSIAIPRERLWAVLENPSAAPSAREGAALALHARLDGAERERLLHIAEKSASPRLRIAANAAATTPPGADPERIRIALIEADAQELEIDDPANAAASAR